MNTQQIREKIEVIVDPASGKTLKETNAIKHIGIDPDKDVVVLIVAITRTGGKEEKQIKRELARIVKIDLGFTGIKIQIEEKRKLESIVK